MTPIFGDPYLLNFLGLEETDREHEMEVAIRREWRGPCWSLKWTLKINKIPCDKG